jgi:hypothetical protein
MGLSVSPGNNMFISLQTLCDDVANTHRSLASNIYRLVPHFQLDFTLIL